MESLRDPVFFFVPHLRSPRSIKKSWPEVLTAYFSRGYCDFKTVGMVGSGAASGILGGPSQFDSMVNNHGDRKSPKWGDSPYKWPKWLINGGY